MTDPTALTPSARMRAATVRDEMQELRQRMVDAALGQVAEIDALITQGYYLPVYAPALRSLRTNGGLR